MGSRHEIFRFPALVLLFSLVLGFLSCESAERWAGTYRAEEISSGRRTEIILHLKEKGEGAWKRGDEEIPFSWYGKVGEVRMNTRGGGVLVGKFHKDALEVTLPGGRTLSFRKMGETG